MSLTFADLKIMVAELEEAGALDETEIKIDVPQYRCSQTQTVSEVCIGENSEGDSIIILCPGNSEYRDYDLEGMDCVWG